MRSAKRWLRLLTISPMLCAGCAAGPSETPCLHLRDYTATEQAAVADEIERLGSGSSTGRFMADYAGLRDQVRAACR